MDKRAKEVNKLLSKIQNGNVNALEELHSKYGVLLLKMAKRYLVDKSLAEDVLSELFLNIYINKAKSFNNKFNGLNWLFKITQNIAFSMNKKHNLVLVEDVNKIITLIDVLFYQDNLIDDVDLQIALEKLSPYENKLLYLKYWEGLTIREIAIKIGKPRSTTQVDIKKILKRLENFLEKH